MSKFARKNSNQATKYALVAFKDTLSTIVCSVDDLTGPKVKCVGATVKVTCNGLVQKGTIVTISDNRETLVNQCEYFDVRKYFGLSRRTKSVQGTNKENMLNKRSNSVAGPIISKNVKNSTPITTRRSVCYNRPLPSPIVNPKDTYELPDATIRGNERHIAKSSSNTTGSSTRLSQRLITDYFSFVTKLPSSPDETHNIEEAMDGLDDTNLSDVFEEDHDSKSIILVNNLDNLFDMVPESLVAKHLREEFDDELNTSTSTSSSYITHNHGICFARDVILNNATRNANVMKYLDLQQFAPKLTCDTQDPEASIASKTTITGPSTDAPNIIVVEADTPTLSTSTNTDGKPLTSTSPSKSSGLSSSTRDIYDELTPMELFRSLMWKCDYSKLDTSLITIDILQHIKLQSKTPEIFARNLMYRLFTIQELKGCNVYGRGYKNGIRNGHLNPDVVKTIHQITRRMFPFVKFSWQNCVRWMNKSIKYVTNLIPEKTTSSDPVPFLSSTVIHYSDTSKSHSTVDVSLIERDLSAFTDMPDNSLLSYHTIPTSTIHRDSSVYIPSLKSTTPESWEDSLPLLTSLSGPTSFKNSIHQLKDDRTAFQLIKPTIESWENSLLQLSKQSSESWEHSLLQISTKFLTSQLAFRTIKTASSWDDSLLHLSINNITPESWEQSLPKNQSRIESWDNSLLHLSINNTSPESWQQSLLKTQPRIESWDDSLLHLSINNTTPQLWEQSLLKTKSWDDSLLHLSIKNSTLESQEVPSIQLTLTSPKHTFVQPTIESWENSLLQLYESWGNLLSTTSTVPESWEDSFLQISQYQHQIKSIINSSPILKSWDDSLLYIPINSTSTLESWDDSLVHIPISSASTLESWDDSLVHIPINSASTLESWDDSLVHIPINSASTLESWDDSLVPIPINSASTLESWEDSLVYMPINSTSTLESWDDSLLQISINYSRNSKSYCCSPL